MSGAKSGAKSEAMNGARGTMGEEPPGGRDAAAARLAFADQLDRYGPDLAAWPVEARAAAERLLAGDAEAEAMHQAAWRVDDALGALMAQSAARPLRLKTRSPAREFMPSWRRLAGFGMAALAASLVLGFVAGTSLPTGGEDDGGSNDSFFMAVNDTDAGGLL